MDILNNMDSLGNAVFAEGESVLQKCADGVLVTERKHAYSSLAAHINVFLGSQEAYKTRYVIKSVKGSFPVAVYHKITIEYIGLEYTVYDYGKSADINDKEFTEIEVSTDIPAGAQIRDVIAYFIQGTPDGFEDIIVKEFESCPAEGTSQVTEVRKTSPIQEQKEVTVGVIRWDAYSETGVYGELNPSDQVARSLTPKEFHFMAPFFARFTDEGKTYFGKADQERFDREAELAVKAGIDYFAYCWYRNSDVMCYARRQHITSKYADKIKMCAIIGVSHLDDETIAELAQNMKESCYLRFDNRPVVYVYDSFKHCDYLEKLIQAVKDAGINEELYLIGMVSRANPFIVNTLLQKGLDAIGMYSFGSLSPDEPFAYSAEQTEKENISRLTYSDILDNVPGITFGRDTRPRIKTPVTWANHGYGGKYTLPPTGEELYLHVKNVLECASKSKPKTCLGYAWNEHDEGGYCCPTVAVDGNGNPIFDSNGDVILKSTQLNALAKAIKEFKGKA